MEKSEYQVNHYSQQEPEVPWPKELSTRELIVLYQVDGDDGYGFTWHIHLATSRHRFYVSDGIDYIQALDNFSEDTIPKTVWSGVPVV